MDLKFVGSNPVRVRVPPSAPIISISYGHLLSELKSHYGVSSVAALYLSEIAEQNRFDANSNPPSSKTAVKGVLTIVGSSPTCGVIPINELGRFWTAPFSFVPALIPAFDVKRSELAERRQL